MFFALSPQKINHGHLHSNHLLSKSIHLQIHVSPLLATNNISTWKCKQNGKYFQILLKEVLYTLINISSKFVPKGSIGNKSALFQVMACRLFGSKPLYEPVMTQFADAYSNTRPLWAEKISRKGQDNYLYPFYTGVPNLNSDIITWRILKWKKYMYLL